MVLILSKDYPGFVKRCGEIWRGLEGGMGMPRWLLDDDDDEVSRREQKMEGGRSRRLWWRDTDRRKAGTIVNRAKDNGNVLRDGEQPHY